MKDNSDSTIKWLLSIIMLTLSMDYEITRRILTDMYLRHIQRYLEIARHFSHSSMTVVSYKTRKCMVSVIV